MQVITKKEGKTKRGSVCACVRVRIVQVQFRQSCCDFKDKRKNTNRKLQGREKVALHVAKAMFTVEVYSISSTIHLPCGEAAFKF